MCIIMSSVYVCFGVFVYFCLIVFFFIYFFYFNFFFNFFFWCLCLSLVVVGVFFDEEEVGGGV